MAVHEDLASNCPAMRRLLITLERGDDLRALHAQSPHVLEEYRKALERTKRDQKLEAAYRKISEICGARYMKVS